MSNNHTPGPWFVIGDFIKAEDGWGICRILHPGSNEQASNANLVAAAPELLEALKTLRDHAFYMAEVTGIPVPSELVAIFESAIAKAEGRV